MTNIHYGVFTDVFRNATSDDPNGWRILVARDPTSTNCAAVALVHSEARDQSSERHIPYLTFFHEITESLPCKCADVNRYLYNGGSSNGSHRSRIKILQAREQALQNADNQAWTAARNLTRSEWKKSSVWDNYQSVWYDVLRQLLRPDKWLVIGSPIIRKDTAHWAHDIFTQLVLNISGALTPVPREQWSSRKFYDGFDDPGIAERAEAYCAPIPKIQVDKSPSRTAFEVQSQLNNKEASTKSIESLNKSRPRAQRWDNNKRMDAYTTPIGNTSHEGVVTSISSSKMSRKAPKGEWIETDTGNKVNRKATLVGTQHIMLGGKTVIMPEAMIRGDLARTVPSTNPSQPGSNTAVFIGRYCFLSKGCCLRPPGRMYKGVFTYMPLRLGDHVFIGEGTVVQAATIGSHVNIGKGAVVGEFAIVKDYVQILDGTIVPTNMVIPSFSIVAGQPARIIGEVPEGGHDAFELRDLYKSVKTTAPAPVV